MKEKEKKTGFNLRLDDSVVRRLKLHAAVGDETASDIVSRLVRQHLPELVVTRAAPKSQPRPSLRTEECTSWLVDALGAGTQRITDMVDDAGKAGFSRSTLLRVAHAHPLITEIVIDGRKYWQLGFKD